MQCIRCSSQAKFTEDDWDGFGNSPEELAALKALVERLRALPDARTVYMLSSHRHLGLLAQDHWNGPFPVSVAAADERCYWIEYLMPADQAPWSQHAHVRGQANSVEQAVEMVLKAMEMSGSWPK